MSWVDDLGSLAGLISIGTAVGFTVKALTINVNINNHNSQNSRTSTQNTPSYYNPWDSRCINLAVLAVVLAYPIAGNQLNKALITLSLMSPILAFFGLLLRVRTQKWNGLSFI